MQHFLTVYKNEGNSDEICVVLDEGGLKEISNKGNSFTLFVLTFPLFYNLELVWSSSKLKFPSKIGNKMHCAKKSFHSVNIIN